MKNRKVTILLIISILANLFFFFFAFAGTIILKTGKQVDGDIVESNSKYISVNIAGVVVPYYLNEILSVDGKIVLGQNGAEVKINSEKKDLAQDFSYDKEKPIDACFFPVEKARWNGYDVLSEDWALLDEYQRNKYFFEAMQEIENKEKVKVLYNSIPHDFLASFERLNNFLIEGGTRRPVITTFLMMFSSSGRIEGELKFGKNSPTVTAIMINSINDKSPEVELGRTYIGYINCFKKDNKWLPDAEGPVIGEVRKDFIFANYTMIPSGAMMLSPNYPIGMEYRVIKFREINSFVDEYGLDSHYYKILFEPVKLN